MKKKPQPQKLWTALGVVACLLVIVPLGYKVVADEAYKSEAAKWRARGKAMGMPESPKDLRKAFVGQNAADLYNQAFSNGSNEDFLREIETAVKDKDWAAAEKSAGGKSGYFDTVVAASKVKDVDFGHTYRDTLSESFPEFAMIKQAVRALRARALLRAHKGDVSGAFDDLGAGMRLARHAGSEPCLIALLVQCACASIVLDTSATVLRDTDGSPAAVEGVRQIAQLWSKPSMKQAVKGEWLMAIQVPRTIQQWADLAAMDSEESRAKAKAAAVIASPFEVQAVALKVQLKVAELGDDNSKLASEKSREAERYTDSLLARCSPPARTLSDIILPVFSQCFIAVAKDESQANLVFAAADVYDYRNRTGKFPTDLSMVGAKKDVWTNGPMGYRLQGKGFVVWGMGQNGKDDGGKLDTVQMNMSPDHIVNMADRSSKALIPPKG